MGIAYIVALVVGGGTLLVQFVGVGDGDADADAGHDFDAHADADADGDVDADAHADGDHGGHHGDGVSVLATFLSLRFWTFGLLAFGLLGSLLHFLRLLDRGIVPLVAVVVGVLSGYFASWAFRTLSGASTTSSGAHDEAVGQVGEVLVGIRKDRRGKVRIRLRGQTVDYLATTDDGAHEPGEQVLVEEVRGDSVHVSAAPPAFLPPKREE